MAATRSASAFYTRDQIRDLMGTRTPTRPDNPRSKEPAPLPAEAFDRINWRCKHVWKALISEAFGHVDCSWLGNLTHTPKERRQPAAHLTLTMIADRTPEAAASIVRTLTTLAASKGALVGGRYSHA